MNITVNDLEMNATLDQSAMADLLGGYKRYRGSWNMTGSSSSGFQYGATHMGSWFRTGNLFQKKRRGHQHGKKTVTYYYRRNITDLTNAFGW